MELQQLKTFEDACQVEGLDASKIVGDFSFMPEKHRQSMQAYARLIIIAQAANRLANGGTPWTPDWNNDDQRKYQAWFWLDNDGGSSGFRFFVYDCWRSFSYVGSRLCFVTREACEY